MKRRRQGYVSAYSGLQFHLTNPKSHSSRSLPIIGVSGWGCWPVGGRVLVWWGRLGGGLGRVFVGSVAGFFGGGVPALGF